MRAIVFFVSADAGFCHSIWWIIQSASANTILLHSLKAITKEATVVAMVLWRPTPDPRFGSPVELSRRDASGLLNFIGIGKALPSQGIASEEAPPALLQVQPTGSLGNEDVVETWMPS
jgi:hypothetical protein